MDTYQNIRQGERGAWISIAAYIALAGCKLLTGAYAGSEALLADGLNNSTDVIASIAVLVGLRISRKPPDRDHRYGHFRAETVASLIASFIMVAVGVQVVYQAVLRCFAPTPVGPDLLSAWVALGCAFAMYAVYRYNFRLAKRINSSALLAAAMDNRSDAWVSAGAFVGIIGSRLGWPWLDPLAAIIVGAIVCKTGWNIFRESTHALTDGFDDKELDAIRQTVAESKGVEAIKDIRARVHGNQVWVDVTILVDSGLNVVESHDITELIEARMQQRHDIRHIHIHIEPLERPSVG